MTPAFKAASPYLCLDAGRLIAQLQVWCTQAAALVQAASVDDLQQSLSQLLREWVQQVPSTTPWLEKGMPSAMALQHLPPETKRLLMSARSRELLWEGLAYAVLHSKSVEVLQALERIARELFPHPAAHPL